MPDFLLGESLVFIRPKLFLSLLAFCMVPLILLALLSYWNDARIAEASIQRDQESRSAELTKSFSELMLGSRTQTNSSQRQMPSSCATKHALQVGRD